MNNEPEVASDVFNEAIISAATAENGKTPQVDEVVTTQAEATAKLERERENKLEKDVLIGEIASFAGGVSAASIHTAGKVAGLGGATAAFAIVESKREAMEEAGKLPAVAGAAALGFAVGAAIQGGKAPAIGAVGAVAAVALWKAAEIVVSDIKEQSLEAVNKESQALLAKALEQQSPTIISAADKVLEIIANKPLQQGEAINERMDNARTLLAQKINTGEFANELAAHQKPDSPNNYQSNDLGL
ncbi:MAG: hypothetical protein ACXWTR_01760 [Methylotenera sp.]